MYQQSCGIACKKNELLDCLDFQQVDNLLWDADDRRTLLAHILAI
jgi:hypothetical protein